MNSGISFTVSGGNVAIGAVAQGNNNVLAGSGVISAQETKLGDAAKQAGLGEQSQEVVDARSHLKSLTDEAGKDSPDISKGQGILKTVRENFAWAYPVFKDVAAASWPALLRLIA